MQFHKHRSERWTVIEGEATVKLGDEVKIIHRNEWIYIPVGERHQLTNNGKCLMQLIEVQIGDYLEEDDIVRLTDKYGRI